MIEKESEMIERRERERTERNVTRTRGLWWKRKAPGEKLPRRQLV